MNIYLRNVFLEQLSAISPKNLVYVDECGIEQCLYREYARAPIGQRIISKISGRKFKRVNFVAGICQGKWVAPFEYTSVTDSILFEFWFENCLLREVDKGSVIVLDNATFHKKSVLPNLAKKHNCEVLFLPPYSPDLNPIEKKWAWLKRRLKKTLKFFDSLDFAIWDAFQVS